MSKMKLALYEVMLGCDGCGQGSLQSDRARSKTVLALTAEHAIKRVRKSKDEYVASVSLLGREE